MALLVGAICQKKPRSEVILTLDMPHQAPFFDEASIWHDLPPIRQGSITQVRTCQPVI